MEASMLMLPAAAPHAALALGACPKENAACALDGARARWSPLHGDLRDAPNAAALDASVHALLDAGPRPAVIAHDLQPGGHGTRLAYALADSLGVPALGVQHHHAHLAVVAAEHGLAEPVVGWALDGAGLGTDGTAWGGELLWLDDPRRSMRWKRICHLPALPLPGGDAAVREPWRMAAAVLHTLGRGDEIVPRLSPDVGVAAAVAVQRTLACDPHAPTTTAAGRWFDAAAAALGVHRGVQADAQAALALENEAAGWLAGHSTPPPLDRHGSLDLAPLVASLFDVPQWRRASGAARFHVSLAAALANAAAAAAEAHGVRTVVLGGGCFSNRILATRVTERLEAAGLRVRRPAHAGCGDAGLALGQAWVASWSLLHGIAPAAPPSVAAGG